MKLFGSGGKHKKNTDPETIEQTEDIVKSDFEYSITPEPEYYEGPAFNEFGESEEQVEEMISAYRRKKHRRFAAVCAVLVVLVAGCIAAYSVFVRPPDISPDELPGIDAPANTDPQETISGAPAESDEPGPAAETEEPQEYIDNGYRKEYRYTFLILGVDQILSNTDTILVGTLDIKDKWMHVVSIPRDTLVNVPWSAKKINTVYASSTLNYDGWGYENGIDGLKRELKDIMGYEPDCWAVIDVEAFKALVDAIGGVYYDVPIDMQYIDPDQDLYIDIKAGYQWLSGEDALKVVRFRTGYAMADIGRIDTQQDFLKSVASQMLTLGNIPNIGKVYDVYEEYVETNLSVGNVAWLLKEFMKIDPEDITFEVLPANYSCMIPAVDGLSYCSIYIDEWLELINSKLSPLDEEITEEDLNILTWDPLRGAESTTGVVAGGQYSFATIASG